MKLQMTTLALAGCVGLMVAAETPGAVMTFQEGTDGFTHDGTRIRADNPDTNENGNQKFWIVGTTGTASIRTVAGYDISALPNNAVITSVTLTLDKLLDGNSAGGTFDAEIHPLTTSFDETTATWNTPWTTPGGDFTSTILSSQSGDTGSGTGAFTFGSTSNFVAAAQDALDNDVPLEFIIKGSDNMEASGNRQFFFFTGDEDGANGDGIAPVLTVNYVPEPSTLMGALGIGGLALLRHRR